MGLIDRIISALQAPLGAEYVRLDDDDGISGFVVSSRFENMSTLDRQQSIDNALRNAADPISDEEQRRILMIAGITPLEYESVGARIRVHKIRDLGGGSLEVVLHGTYSDAMYVRGVLDSREDVTATEPVQSPGAVGVLMTFRAKGTQTNPLTKEKATGVLEADKYIRVMQEV